jgi:hypothetical protein
MKFYKLNEDLFVKAAKRNTKRMRKVIEGLTPS